jgi:SNF2 family DNA or RNA helicase
VRTPLQQHQHESFQWQQTAWMAGLPGILNADEQGLGKTLQTITLLAWLQDHMNGTAGAKRLPILIVAPTSLLMNWEQEVALHLDQPGLGRVIRLYGAGTSARKAIGATGIDIQDGTAKLDLDALHESIEDQRAHRYWILTTYTTLTNYQHSLAKLPFAAAVFDEIQAIKNPDSMRAWAARAINADFRIGLTGTPIENSTRDLWAIMDQIAAGSLDTRVKFREAYSAPTAGNMGELHNRVFKPRGSFPALALRRLKQDAAPGLPAKTRRLHPRPMPPQQALIYEDAKLKLAQGGLGAALKMLHHIRSVSVHPSLESSETDTDMIAASARLQATFDILRRVAQAKERALVFIEHRQMQYRFMQLAKAEFGLADIDLINGDTPIQKRQAIVNRFQKNGTSPGFDLLVLGPKAAGTGLTLTAATHVIHLSRWWNPAVEEQCNDRVHRIGQTRPVSVHVPMAIHPDYREHSFDCLLHSLMHRKRKLASSALWPMGDTEADAGELRRMVTEGVAESGGDSVTAAITAMFERDGLTEVVRSPDGSFPYP